MSDWTKQRLEQMIADKVEESLSVEYKCARALVNSDRNKADITKEVSALANSSGGLLIYGIAEPDDKNKRHLPERLDPIVRTDFSKEALDQVIQSIQPRIDGVVIHPVTTDESGNTVCYVVEVPQSSTAHQSRDHIYYKRHNFNVLPMEDYEVRDVMNRRTQPNIRGAIFVNRNTSRFGGEGFVLVRLENTGRVMAQYVMVELELPIDMGGLIAIEQPVISKSTDEGNCQYFRMNPEPADGPLFPGSDLTLRRRFRWASEITDMDGKPQQSTSQVRICIFADEMPPIRATLDIAPVLLGWTPIQSDLLN